MHPAPFPFPPLRRPAARAGLVALLVPLGGCLSTAEPELSLPWDPAGEWVGEMSGTVSDAAVTDSLRVTMTADRVQVGGQSGSIVELSGTWAFGGLTGLAQGFWLVGRDLDAASGGGCPDFLELCSFVLVLRAPGPACTLMAGAQEELVELGGWFDGPDDISVAGLMGTYWEDQPDPPPCTGGVTLEFDTEGALVRQP